MPETHVEGYIVEGPEGHFLNQTRTGFVPQGDEGGPHVHTMEELANCPNRRIWSPKVIRVWFGRWSSALTLSCKVGQGMDFETFVCCLNAIANANAVH
jgi:hypothetical protein